MHKIYRLLMEFWSTLWARDREVNPLDTMTPAELADLPPYHEAEGCEAC